MGFIVVGIDSSETAREAFRQAVRQAEWRNATIVALHVVPAPVVMGYEFSAITLDLEAIRAEGAAFLAAEIMKVENEVEGGISVPIEQRVAIGHTGTEIIRASQGADGGLAELVVLGSRGYGGFRGLLLGSVTTYAVHHLACPLLIIPSKEEDR